MRSTIDTLLNATDNAFGQPKKPYCAPRLTVHGTVEQLTHNVGTGAYDFPDGSQIQA
jgi:hypothetical protein